MHIIIGFLSALATLLFALDRLGIDLGWFNPWAWKRRRAWIRKSTANPAYSLDKPIDAIALIATAAAKIDGDLSIEEKESLRTIFQAAFNTSEMEAAQMLGSSVYLLGSGEDVFQSPEKVLKRSLESFSEAQKRSSVQLLSEITGVGGGPSNLQTEFVAKVNKIFFPGSSTSEW